MSVIPRLRGGKLSVYEHHAWWVYYRDGGWPRRRRLLRGLGEVSEGALARELRKVLAAAGLAGVTRYTRRGSVTTTTGLVRCRPTPAPPAPPPP